MLLETTPSVLKVLTSLTNEEVVVGSKPSLLDLSPAEAVVLHARIPLSQWRMISYLDFTPVTISFLGRATGTAVRSCLTGKESRAGHV